MNFADISEIVASIFKCGRYRPQPENVEDADLVFILIPCSIREKGGNRPYAKGLTGIQKAEKKKERNAGGVCMGSVWRKRFKIKIFRRRKKWLI
jgi:hypothetical protein